MFKKRQLAVLVGMLSAGTMACSGQTETSERSALTVQELTPGVFTRQSLPSGDAGRGWTAQLARTVLAGNLVTQNGAAAPTVQGLVFPAYDDPAFPKAGTAAPTATLEAELGGGWTATAVLSPAFGSSTNDVNLARLLQTAVSPTGAGFRLVFRNLQPNAAYKVELFGFTHNVHTQAGQDNPCDLLVNGSTSQSLVQAPNQAHVYALAANTTATGELSLRFRTPSAASVPYFGAFVLSALTRPGVQVAPATAITATPGSRLSAAIYDANGNRRRVLHELAPRTGTFGLSWDGRDDLGYELPTGKYHWRAVTTQAVGSDDGSVGDRGVPIPGVNITETEHPSTVHGVAYDGAGNLYLASQAEEDHGVVRRIDAANLETGVPTWEMDPGPWRAESLAVDSTYVYTATDGSVFRLNAATRALVPWPSGNSFSAYTPAYFPGDPHTVPAPQRRPGDLRIPGLAVLGDYLVVSNPRDNRVQFYNKADGTPANIIGSSNYIDVIAPRALAAAGTSELWIAAHNAPQPLPNASFESPVVASHLDLAPTPSGAVWSFSGRAGLRSERLWESEPSPVGVQTGYVGGAPGATLGVISQTVQFTQGGRHAINFLAARRADQVQPIEVRVNGALVATITPTSNRFQRYSTPAFTIASAGAHVISFSATTNAVEAMSLLDDIRIVRGTVSRWTIGASGATMTATTEPLDQPFGVAWHAGSAKLYVSESGTGHVRRYGVSGTTITEEQRAFSNMLAPGDVSDNRFGWGLDAMREFPHSASIAVSPTGDTLAVADYWNQRTLFVNTASLAVQATPRLQGLLTPTPDVDLRVGEEWLSSGGRYYHIQYGAPDAAHGHPWTYKQNWNPGEVPDVCHYPVRRRLANELEYMFCLIGPGADEFPGGGILVYRLNAIAPGLGMRRVAKISQVYGPADDGPITVTTDTNGNGVLGDAGDSVVQRAGQFGAGLPGMWVDTNGTVWWPSLVLNGDWHYAVGRLPLSGFDERDNPVYDLSAAGPVTRIGRWELDRSVGVSEFYRVQDVRPDASGNRLLALVYAPSRLNDAFNQAGNALMTIDPATGNRSWWHVPTVSAPLVNPSISSLRATIGSIALDAGGQYAYSVNSVAGGPGQQVHMFTHDGLPIATAAGNPASSSGWIDHSLSLTAFRHSNGTYYAYTKDNGNGRNNRYAFSNVDSTQRFGSTSSAPNAAGAFDWTASSAADGLVGWWRFDERIAHHAVDSSGANRFATVWSGLWEPLSLWDPLDGVFHGSVLMNGTRAILLSKYYPRPGTNMPQSQPDNLFDGTLYPNPSVSMWFKTTSSGVLLSQQSSPHGTTVAQSRTMLQMSLDGRLHASAPGASTLSSADPLNDNQWHHAAFVLEPARQVLYVDGKLVGESARSPVTSTLSYTMIGAIAPGGQIAGFAGKLDEVRVYGRPLTATEVGRLAEPPAPSGPIAWWKLDETGGTTAADSASGDRSGTTHGASFEPSAGRRGGALNLPGNSALVVPDSIIENPAYTRFTVASWIRTTATGVPILGHQHGTYPVSSRRWFGTLLSIDSGGRLLATLRNRPAVTSASAINDGAWHHVALTVNPGAITVYVDGISAGTYTRATPSDDMLYPAGLMQNQFGAAFNGTSWTYFSGRLDDVLVYGRDLSAAEVAWLAR